MDGFSALLKEIAMTLLKRVRRLKGGVGLAVCECSHLQAEHSSLLMPLDGERMYREYNHGGCVECSCRRFTFSQFVSLDEAAYMMGKAAAIS